MSEPYALLLTLHGLPKMANQLLRGHWRVKHAHAMKWKLAVSLACHGRLPARPLERANVSIVRCSSVRPDFDGLVSSGKPLLDGLVEAGVLADDTHAVIAQPEYAWEKAPPRGGHTRVEVRAC